MIRINLLYLGLAISWISAGAQQFQSTYSWQTQFSINGVQNEVQITDLDGDPHKDVIALMEFYFPEEDEQRTELYSFLGDGQGGFMGPYYINVNTKTFAVGDIDGDGDQDIVSDTHIHLRESNGTYTYISNPIETDKLTLSDLDNDDDLDIVFSYYTFPDPENPVYSGGASVGWIENDGSGSFSAPMIIHDEFGFYQSSYCDFEVADLDGDGNKDIVLFEGENYYLVVFKGDGDGLFVPTYEDIHESYVALGGYFSDMTVLDVDQDQKQDILLSTGYEGIGELAWVSLDSSLRLIPTVNYLYTPFDEEYNIINSLRQYRFYGMVPTDYDNDGDIDVLVGAEGGEDLLSAVNVQPELVYMENLGQGGYTLNSQELQEGAYRKLQACDMDSDGDVDLVSVGNQLNLFLNQETGCETFSSAPVDLRKTFAPVPYPEGAIDRVQLKWHKASPGVRYDAFDNAACDIEFWPVRDLITGENLNHLPHSLLEKRKKPGQDLWKWPIMFDCPDVMPNTRYKWRVRCHCNEGDGPVSPWSETKFFATPDFDPATGIYSGKATQAGIELEKTGVNQYQILSKYWITISVYDLSGREVKQISANGNHLDLSDLKQGTYLLHMVMLHGVVISKKAQVL